MPLKNKTMALIRLRKTPYSGLLSFLQDVFFRQENLAEKAIVLLGKIYSGGYDAKSWKSVVSELFNVTPPSGKDEEVIDEACVEYLGFHRENIRASKARLRGKKAYKEMMEREDIPKEIREVLGKVSEWNSAVTAYYSIINKFKALGLIEKSGSSYVMSDKFSRRLLQVASMLEGFKNETKH